jgi:outer membrane protein insertion porin family
MACGVRTAWVLFACACALFADPARFEGKKIATVQFVPREQPVGLDEIYSFLPLKRGETFRMEAVRSSIVQLYATGYYTDIQVDAEMLGDQVVIRFLTKNAWFIGQVSAEGKFGDPPNKGQVVNATRLQLGHAFSEERLEEAKTQVRELFESNGYYNPQVETQLEYDDRLQEVAVRVLVEVRERAKFERPEVSGDLKMPEETIVKATKWNGWIGWRPVTHNRLLRGIDNVRRKYHDQDRLMASVTAESLEHNAETNRVKPLLRINAGPKVEVRTVGAKISRGKLKRLIPVYDEGTVDRDLLVEGAKNLRDYLQSEGYFEAEVEFKQQRVVRDRAVIDYLINQGTRHRLVKVEIGGNKYFGTDTLRARMFLMPNSFQFRRGRYSESLRRRDEEAIANVYRENGFRDVKVTSNVIDDYGGKKGDLAVAFDVQEGAQWFVASLSVEGMERLDKEKVLATLDANAGQPFSEYNVAVDRDNILGRYSAEGFYNVTFDWQAQLGERPNTVNLKYVIQEGPRRFVRQVIVSGLTTTRPDLVNRNLGINPGDPLSQIQIAETQRKLYELGVFARVDAAVQNPDGETENKVVIYQMEEAKRYSFATGLGAEVGRIGGGTTSLDSPGGSGSFSPRVSLDVSRLNFLGLGHTVSFKSRLSTIQKRALVNYSAPRLRNKPGLNLSFTALYDHSNDIRTFTELRREASVQLSQRLTKATTALYRFSYRKVSVDNVHVIVLPVLANPARIGILSGTFIQDRRDDPVESHRGIYNTVDIGYASRIFGSQADFTRFLGRNASYKTFAKKYVFARSIDFGWLNAFSLRTGGLTEPADVPLAERLFAGGSNSHRGFAENQAGPRDTTTGFPLGGRALLVHKMELRFPLLGDNIGGVLFHDAGNVFSRVQSISFRVSQKDIKDFDYMVHAVGFGVRYRTPIGPLRLDLAWAPNSPRFFGCSAGAQNIFDCGTSKEQRLSRLQFHFSIGQAF